jgi:hypothetical protein
LGRAFLLIFAPKAHLTNLSPQYVQTRIEKPGSHPAGEINAE